MITSNPIQILMKNDSDHIDIIRSPMKYEILELLRHNEMNFEEIVENTSKSKAAVSLHLKDLKEEGIVKYKSDPHDNRKRIFYLNSEMLASIDTRKSQRHDGSLIEEFLNNDSAEFSHIMTHTLKNILNGYGIEINPIFESIGNLLGEYIFAQVHDDDIDIFLFNISKYWSDSSLGTMTFDVKNSIKINIADNFESERIEKTGLPECHITSGILEDIFSRFFLMPVSVTEVMCCSMGDGMCLFEIEPSSS